MSASVRPPAGVPARALLFYVAIAWLLEGSMISGKCGKAVHARCEIQVPNTLSCSSGLPKKYYNISNFKTKNLFICNLSGPAYKPYLISFFPQLENFSLTQSNITHFTSSFPAHNNVKVMNLSYLLLETLKSDTFAKLKALESIDLSYNRFNNIGQSIFLNSPKLQHIYLQGNPWNCSSNLKWLVKDKDLVTDLHLMYCAFERYYNKPVLPIMKFAVNLESECNSMADGRCQCTLDNVVWSPNEEYLIPVTTVNCSSLKLRSLPQNLPTNTTILLLRNNNISDLTTLVSDSSYHHVADIYLDYNEIENIDKLEGAAWLSNFRVFSIKYNKIKVLPTYAFDNAFERNKHAAKVFFGSNPWTCDCGFIPAFKDLLAKHHTIIQDSDDIKCIYEESSSDTWLMVRDLSRASVCREPSDFWLNPLDWLNIFLTILILLIIARFAYDYWVYKSSGKLPWIAMKLL